jgi:hypothetical protein
LRYDDLTGSSQYITLVLLRMIARDGSKVFCTRLREPIECGVDLSRWEDGGVLFELALLLRVEDSLPFRVTPTACSKQNLRHGRQHPRNSLCWKRNSATVSLIRVTSS